MDGFHYDNAVLDRLGLRARKGAPETFDALGFLHLMQRLRAGGDAAIPVFDRDADLARAGADMVTGADKYLIVEGNYLLLNETPWCDLAPLFDLTVFIDVPEAELDRRLVARWDHHGKTPAEARHWIDSNDMPNIRRVTQGSRQADIVIGGLGRHRLALNGALNAQLAFAPDDQAASGDDHGGTDQHGQGWHLVKDEIADGKRENH